MTSLGTNQIWKPRIVEQNSYWRGVLERDRRLDGAFVFAVRSTGIYCRPSCPSRRPARKQVTFFALPEAAERAGFRPCRRCHPRDTRAANPQAELVQRVCEYIDSNLEEPLPLRALSARVETSPFHLQRTFKRLMGISPREYADAQRMHRFKSRLREGKVITDAMYEAGYGSSSRLYERAGAQLGMTPATYRKGGRGMSVGYTIADCPLGRILVAATPRGICMVSLGNADSVLEAALVSEYPHAEIHRGDSELTKWVKSILSNLNGHERRLDLPLDIEATAFQRRVWQELRRIPYGRTRTYSEVARAIGRPRAVRAVARACATNPVPLVIPCHRVIREDGNLAGYRWGLKRKSELLRAEQNRRSEQGIRAAG
ncbi:MAG: bifunctional DNA-binding transcriptional regulator/O6-methylguanine-DNA methyltransferase Ada [Terriglobia bacterium]